MLAIKLSNNRYPIWYIFEHFSFLKQQSSAFKEAFFGPPKYDFGESSRAKRQVKEENINETQIENEISDDAEGLSRSLANEEQSQITVDESSTLGDEGDAAINCNWNIKVYI